ncbi:MAG: undecaprenyl-diphosphatase UppP [Omnitrophica bacterium GWA2_52_8]|nr:MAG: undecaprenyl-diphosphatase UppP [Omnitrophica bacterium GWA2_52_8]
MTEIQALILGILQGLTEFLPVSSSGHLVFLQNVFGLEGDLLAFDIVVHFGTLLAVFCYFWRDLIRITADTCGYLTAWVLRRKKNSMSLDYPYSVPGIFVFVGSLPTAVIAFGFKDLLEKFYNWLPLTIGAWVVMGVLLILSKKISNEEERTLFELNHQDAFWIGTLQGLAIIPGISRSGSTILAGMFMGLEKDAAARYSFLLAIPAIVGAGLLKMKDGIDLFHENTSVMLIGFFASAVAGYFTIACLMSLIRRSRFYVFGYYLLTIAVIASAFMLFKG